MKIKSLVLVTFALGVLSQANAILVNNGTYTTDTESGLDWLDISYSDGMSYNQSLASNTGWRMATLSEVMDLLENAYGGELSGAIASPAFAVPFKEIIDCLGATGTYTAGNGASFTLWGYVASQQGDLSHASLVGGAGIWSYYEDGDPVTGGIYNDLNFGSNFDAGSAARAAFLVRASEGGENVPDTGSTLALFGAAFLGLIGFRRRFAK